MSKDFFLYHYNLHYIYAATPKQGVKVRIFFASYVVFRAVLIYVKVFVSDLSQILLITVTGFGSVHISTQVSLRWQLPDSPDILIFTVENDCFKTWT